MVKKSTRKGSRGRRQKTTQQKKDAKQFATKMAAATPPPSLPKPPPAPSGFTHLYGPGVLAEHGPLVLAYWSVPTVVEEFLRNQGSAVPAPVHGALLLDTGATGTCISIKAADQLGLKATRLAPGFGAGGATNNPFYNAKLSITMVGPDGSGRVLQWDKEVQGIPELEKHLLGKPLTYSGASMELIGLLGRDILAATRFQYDGLIGTLQLDFDLVAMGLA